MEEIKKGYKQTDIGVIPKDWDIRPIGEVLKVTTGNKNTQDKKDDGIYPFFVRSQTVERINTYTFDGEGVLTAGDGVGTGKVFHYINGKFDYHQRVYLMHGFDDKVLGKYFFWFFSKYFYERINQLTAKSSVDSVRREMIADMLMPLPKKDEQTAIATALSDTDVLIAALDKKIAKKQQIKQGAMQQLLTGKKRLSGFSGEWVEKRLGEGLRFQTGDPFSSLYFNANKQGIRLIKNRDLKSDDQVIYYSGSYTSDFLVNNGDVLIGMDGDFLPCIWNKGTALLNQRVGRLIFKSDWNPNFLFYYLYNPLKDLQEATGATTVKHLSHKDVEEMVLPLPPTSNEQTAIAQILTDMDNEIAKLEKERDKYKDLKAGMMQVLLTGKVRLV